MLLTQTIVVPKSIVPFFLKIEKVLKTITGVAYSSYYFLKASGVYGYILLGLFIA